jgi:hypothetical protein
MGTLGFPACNADLKASVGLRQTHARRSWIAHFPSPLPAARRNPEILEPALSAVEPNNRWFEKQAGFYSWHLSVLLPPVTLRRQNVKAFDLLRHVNDGRGNPGLHRSLA